MTPNFGWPSGQRGAGFTFPLVATASVSGASDKRLPLASTTVLPLASLLPSRADQPSMVTESPTLREPLLQPDLRKSSGLAHSTAQLVTSPLASLTSR